MAPRSSGPHRSEASGRATTEDLLERLGVGIDPGTLALALTHRSYAYEHGGLPTNERLEFLGDSVVGFVVTDHLYRTHPTLPEGDLARMRAAVVSTRALASVARSIGVGAAILLGEGEKRTRGRDKDSILADTMEALIGATYMECGMDEARALVHRLVVPLLDDELAMGAGTDWKTYIQEAAAGGGLGGIEYRMESTGPDHDKVFTATLVVGGTPYASGTGSSKKEAERQAAERSWPLVSAAAGAAPPGTGTPAGAGA
ncbi:ribonuclease III [Citricoccus sp. SGAir0253]|uniref:ribonuclease III n=1 Tax=Citricoccus sp. SGAir0253 TaxID=2567881 RepID=UPI0010CCF5BF|nr:ribonuclease III [Citricoccus sp. SGAir0253]QCU78361.1 ribonuclease III [Citricoccus sp. SGAir0253]